MKRMCCQLPRSVQAQQETRPYGGCSPGWSERLSTRGSLPALQPPRQTQTGSPVFLAVKWGCWH